MSWFRRKRIDTPVITSAGGERSEKAVKDSEKKLEQARKQQDEVLKVVRRSKELNTHKDYFAEALERAMRRDR